MTVERGWHRSHRAQRIGYAFQVFAGFEHAGALGRDEGSYSFRQWTAQATAPASGAMTAMVRCTNTKQVSQPMAANWNGGGFMRNVVETVQLAVA